MLNREGITEHRKEHAGSYGWALLGAGVLAWDVFAPQTLSSAYDRYLEHPVKRVLAVGAVAVTASHLLNLLPEQYDPIQIINNRLAESVVRMYGR